MLRIVRDHDELESRGATRRGAGQMRARGGAYDPQLLKDYARALGLMREARTPSTCGSIRCGWA